MNLSLMTSFLSSFQTTAERTAAVEAALLTPAGQKLRDELGGWVIRILPADQIVPEIYAAWRPLVRDAMLFMITHLSAARLAPKLVEQWELPAETKPEARLLRLISKVPGLQKIGQVLARNRHFDPAFRAALSELENGISDVRPGEIRALIRKKLGRRLKTFRVEIDTEMLAEASVSAVMRFSWTDPETGAPGHGVFKVLKPYVAACFAEDLDLLQQLAHALAAKHPEYGRALPETLMETRRLLEHEVDFPREQKTLVEAARIYRGMRGVRVPRLMGELSSRTITAMSEERGEKVTDALAVASSRERRRAAEQLIEALVAAPIFARRERGIFHADPHAGNLLYDQSTGELVLLDWALTERLTREQRRHTALLALMLGLRDAVGVVREIEALSIEQPLPRSLCIFVQAHVEQFIGQMPLFKLPGSMDAMRLLDRIALEGVRFPPGLMMFRKVLFTLDGILHDMKAPGVNLDAVVVRHLVSRWAVGSPLSLWDWIAVESSALFYGARVWVQWAQAALAQ